MNYNQAMVLYAAVLLTAGGGGGGGSPTQPTIVCVGLAHFVS